MDRSLPRRGHLTIAAHTTPFLALCFLLISASGLHAQARLSDLQSIPCIDPARPCATTLAHFDAPAAVPSTEVAAEGRTNARFHFVMGAFITAASTDLAVSMYQIGRGTARERAFGAHWQDSPVVFAATKSAATAMFVFGAQRLHKARPKTAMILGIAQTAVEALLVVRSARMNSTVQ